MAKKRQRATQTSKGTTHQNPSRLGKRIQKQLRREYNGSTLQIINKINAHNSGKKTLITIPNTNKEETNKPFIKVSGKEFFNRTGSKSNASTSN